MTADTTQSPTAPNEVENPITNSPFAEPACHWQIEQGKPPVKAPGRRPASYFYRVPEGAAHRRKAKRQGSLLGDTAVGQQEDLYRVNWIRGRLKEWREAGWPGASGVTRELLDLWRAGSDRRAQRLFFAQVEAAETVIFLVEAAETFKRGMPPIPRDTPGAEARAAGARALIRYACKMATGTGKTTVMGMLTAWSILNRVAEPTDNRFSDTLLVVCPNVIIRERLKELDPALGDLSLYRTRQPVPPERMEDLRRGEVMIANWHRLAKREASSVNGDSARVVKTGEPVEVVKNAGKANESVKTRWFPQLARGRGHGRIDSRVVQDLEAGGTKHHTRRLRFILDTIGKRTWPGGRVPEEWAYLVRRNNEKAAGDEADGDGGDAADGGNGRVYRWIDERIPKDDMTLILPRGACRAAIARERRPGVGRRERRPDGRAVMTMAHSAPAKNAGQGTWQPAASPRPGCPAARLRHPDHRPGGRHRTGRIPVAKG